MKRWKLVFMGTPAFAVPTLKALQKAGHDIVAVYSQPPRPANRGQKETPSPVQALAESYGIPVYTPTSLKDAETQETFRLHHAEMAVVAAYGLLLPKPILEAYPYGCINVHPSLLPRWRGAAPIQRTIMSGDTQTAMVIMQMNEGLDTGDMLLVEPYTIPSRMNAGELHDVMAEKGGEQVLKVLEGLAAGTITPKPQSEEGVTYAKKIQKTEAYIGWNQSSDIIDSQIRGLSPWPGAYTLHNKEMLKILEAEPVMQGKTMSDPGTVLDHHLTISCETGAIRALKVQRPGKKVMTTEELLRGYSISPGEKLG